MHSAADVILSNNILLDEMPVACIFFDENTLLPVYCNISATNLYGFAEREAFIARYSHLLPKLQPDGMDSRVKLRCRIAETIKSGHNVFDFMYTDSTGVELPVELTMSRVEIGGKFFISAYIRELRGVKSLQSELSLHARMLQAVNKMAMRLIESGPDDFEYAISFALKTIGQAVGADRSYIWENFVEDGRLFCRQIYEWSENAEPQQGKAFTVAFEYDSLPFWKDLVLKNLTLNGPVRLLEDRSRSVLEQQGIKSILMIPISYRGLPWGFIGFDDCRTERTFAQVKEQMLRSSGILIVSSIVRQDITRRLVDTKNQLLSQEGLLRAVNNVAKLLLGADRKDFKITVHQALMALGLCVNASQAAIWRNLDDENRLLAKRLADWSIGRTFDLSDCNVLIDYEKDLPQWLKVQQDLSLPPGSNNMKNLFGYNNNRILLLPLTIHGSFWGFIAFSLHSDEHSLSESERNILQSGGMLIASAVVRNEIMENLVRARENALASARAKSEFLSRMSHEIRTPMNAIISMTSLAKKSRDMLRIQHYLETVDASSRHLLSIINDVLDMSKIDADKLEILNREFDFEEMLQHVFDVVNVKLSEKRIDFRLDYPHTFHRNIVSDDLRISQVLINLLSNAIKFTPKGGVITLKVYETQINDRRSMLRLEVHDTGIGIAPEQLSNIFRSFEQADGSVTRKYGGTGLGLAISERIITLMGGTIQAQSEPGSGSVFTIELEVEWREKSSDSGQVKGLPSDLRILVVDDAPDVLEYFIAVLESFSLKCDTALSGKDAVEAVLKHRDEGTPYNVIFLDWYMPGLSGLETAREIKAIMNDDVLVIMISTAGWGDIEREAAEAGIRYFLAKPVLSSNLYNTLMQLTSVNAPAVNIGAAKWRNIHILVADDIDINREIVAALLEDTGINIDFAENGRQAIDMYSANPNKYRLILMDVQMPVLDGLNATVEIRSSGISGCKDIPIIAMTAHAFKENEEASYAAGMNGHISKPIDPEALIDMLNNVLDS